VAGWFKLGSLRSKIVAWSFIPTAIILMAVALFGIFSYRRVAEDLVVERNRELTRLTAGQLATELADYAEVLSVFGRAASVAPGDPAAMATELQEAHNRLVVFDGGVVVLNAHGVVQAADPPRPEIAGQDWSNRDYFRSMVRSPGPTFSNIVPDGAGGAPVIVVAVPISGVRGEFLGMSAGMFRLGATTISSFYGSIVKLRIGADATAYLVDQGGRVIYHGDAGRIGEDFSAQPAVQRVLSGQVEALRTVDVAGAEIVAAYAPVPGTPWGLVTEVSWQALLAPSRTDRFLQLGLLVLGVIIPAIVVSLAVGRITQPIRQLSDAAREVARGKFNRTVRASTGDELEELVQQFNRMSSDLSASYAALKASEERYELVIRATNDGIWDWDLRSNEVYFSPRWKGMLGYEDDEIRNDFDEWANLIVPEDRPRIMKAVQDYLDGRMAEYRLEHRLRHKDGQYRWVLTRGMAFRDAQGRPYRMSGSHTDITPRKLAEEALQERLAFERLTASVSTEFINLAPEKIDVGIQHALEAAGRLLGVERACVFLREDAGAICCAHEWHAGGGDDRRQTLAGLPLDTWPSLGEKNRAPEAVCIPDVEALPAAMQMEKHSLQAQGVRSMVLVPMAYRGEPVGFVGFADTHGPRTWSEDSIASLRIIGEIFVNALEHKRAQAALHHAYQTLERRVEERTHELAALNAITAVVSGSLDLEEIMRDALDKTLQVLGLEFGGAYRLQEAAEGSEEGAYLSLLTCRGLPERFARLASTMALADSPVETAAATGRPFVWLVEGAAIEHTIRRVLLSAGVCQVVSIPLMAKGRLVGSLQLGARQERSFTPDQLDLLAAIGQQVGVATENARLYEQAEQSAAMVERTRLARDLHDSVTQSLYSVMLYAEAAARTLTAGDQVAAADHLRELRDTAQEALREMRLLIFELRPSTLEKSGLVGALQARLESVEMRGGIRTEFQVEGRRGAEQLPLAVQDELYHIAQEALNNSLKHARAQRVSVRLDFRDDVTVLEVADDGVGFEPVAGLEGGGLGLDGMEERTQKIGGMLLIDSAPGRGTLVKVEVPRGGSDDIVHDPRVVD